MYEQIKMFDELKELEEKAIQRLKMFEPEEGYYLAFSGGKDSVVIHHLAKLSKVKFQSMHSITTVDPPELMRLIKKEYPDTQRIPPEINMWDLIVKKRMPPTRIVRYCCAKLKEDKGQGRTVITGVRWAESSKRSNRKDIEFDVYGSRAKAAIENREIFLNSDNDEKRRMLETCQIKGKHVLNPIIDWKDEHVWEFIKKYELPYSDLYEQGFKRLGCIGCPMQGTKGMIRDFRKWPTYYRNYLKAFDRMVESQKADGLNCNWDTGLDVMTWWLAIDRVGMENLHAEIMDKLIIKKEMIP